MDNRNFDFTSKIQRFATVLNEAKLFIRPRNIFTLGSLYFSIVSFFNRTFYQRDEKVRCFARRREEFSQLRDTREIRNASDSFFVEARSRLTADACNTEPHQFPQK